MERSAYREATCAARGGAGSPHASSRHARARLPRRSTSACNIRWRSPGKRRPRTANPRSFEAWPGASPSRSAIAGGSDGSWPPWRRPSSSLGQHEQASRCRTRGARDRDLGGGRVAASRGPAAPRRRVSRPGGVRAGDPGSAGEHDPDSQAVSRKSDPACEYDLRLPSVSSRTWLVYCLAEQGEFAEAIARAARGWRSPNGSAIRMSRADRAPRARVRASPAR